MALSDADLLNGDGCPDLGIPHCLDCPLPACRFSMPPGKARVLLQAMQLKSLLAEGPTIAQAAVRLGVSRRTVYRLREMLKTQGGTRE